MVTAVKYTKEQEKELYDAYISCDNDDQREKVIQDYQDEFSKIKRSIIAKLSKMGIYKARIKISKVTGDVPETKSSMVKRFEEKYDYVGLEGLDKAPKLTLQKLLREK